MCLALIGGCASWSPETKVEEGAWLSLHVVDAIQTSRIAQTPGVIETESAWAIGREPSIASTAGYFAVAAALHFAVTDALVRYHANPWVIRAWEAVTIADSARCVVVNRSLGLGP